VRTNEPSSAARLRQAGLTILEMLVSSAMLALIIVGLTAMFIQTQKAFKTGIKQTEVGDTGLTISRLIASDLAQLSDGRGFNNNPPVLGESNVVNLIWGWDGQEVQLQDGVAFRTNQLQSIYMLVHTNTGWTGIGYVVSNIDNLGVGTLYRYECPVNAHYFDNRILFHPFQAACTPNFSNQAYAASPSIRLSRIADGVVHLKIRVYDNLGNQVGVETNRNIGDFAIGPITNGYPFTNNFVNPRVAVGLPTSVDLELGILEPDAWDHLNSLGQSNTAAQVTYLSTAAGKIDIFHQRILVRAATLQ